MRCALGDLAVFFVFERCDRRAGRFEVGTQLLPLRGKHGGLCVCFRHFAEESSCLCEQVVECIIKQGKRLHSIWLCCIHGERWNGYADLAAAATNDGDRSAPSPSSRGEIGLAIRPSPCDAWERSFCNSDSRICLSTICLKASNRDL